MTELERYEGGTIVTRRDLRSDATDSWTDVLDDIVNLAQNIAGTDFVPASFKGSVPAVAATILTGRELGFAPMNALASLHSIKGRVGLSAEAMRALVMQAGHEIVVTESSSQKCTMKGRRAGSEEWTSVTWTQADARQAGLLNGSGWQNYPRQMLQARASSELCRLAFPDVIRGLASLEEISDYDVLPGPAAPATDNAGAKPAPVKRAPRKRAAAPTAEPADAPELPDDAAAPTEVPEQPPAPDLPEPASPSADVPDESGSVPTPDAPDAPGTDTGTGEAPAEGDVVDAEIVEDDPLESAPINQGQMSLMQLHFNRLGIKDRDERLMLTCAVIGRIVESSKALTFKEATALIHVLESSKDESAFRALVDAAGTEQ